MKDFIEAIILAKTSSLIDFEEAKELVKAAFEDYFNDGKN